MSVEVSQLKKALEIAARLVSEYGDDYLPAFERIEREVIKSRSSETAAARARAIAQGRDQSSGRAG